MMPLHYRRHNIGFLFCAEIPFIYTRWRFEPGNKKCSGCVRPGRVYGEIYTCTLQLQNAPNGDRIHDRTLTIPAAG